MYYESRMDCELKQYGILGQKWGIRRFQNKDGSLTSNGIKRYSDSPDGKGGDDTAKRSKTLSKGKLSKTGDSELKDRIDRLQLEERYSDLAKRKKERNRGLVSRTIRRFGSKVWNTSVDNLADRLINKVWGKEDGRTLEDFDRMEVKAMSVSTLAAAAKAYEQAARINLRRSGS